LATAQGKVVGINTMITRGLALAIPSKTVELFSARPKATPTRLGVTVRPIVLKHAPGQMGFVLIEIAPHSAAERASLLLGDVLVGASGAQFRFIDDLENAIYSAGNGSLEFEFLRGASPHRRKVVACLETQAARAA
jgi:serine protease Do